MSQREAGQWSRRRIVAVVASLVAGSVLYGSPAVAEPYNTPSSTSSQQNAPFNGQRVSIRPVENQGSALRVESASLSVDRRADESDAQTFVPERLPNGYYAIRAGDRFVKWTHRDGPLEVVSGDAATQPRAQWQFDRQSTGTYVIRARGESSWGFTWNTYGHAVSFRAFPTQWVILPIGGALVDGANYAFAWQANTFYTLDVEGAPAVTPGARARLTPWGGFPTQWWRVQYNPEFGTYRLNNLNNLNLALEHDPTTHHAILQDISLRLEQQWTVRPGLRGGWELISLSMGSGAQLRALDNNHSVSAAARVDVNLYTGAAGQEWEIVGPRR